MEQPRTVGRRDRPSAFLRCVAGGLRTSECCTTLHPQIPGVAQHWTPKIAVLHKTARSKSPSCTTFAAENPRVEQHHASSWPVAPTEFAGRLELLGPFEPAPHLAVAVSGGPDSVALAILAATWASERGGTVLALIVDHRIRPEFTAEAATVAERLTARNMPSRILTLSGLTPGPALAERARQARYHALATACREAGILNLLLGHHAADQAETLMIRVLARSASRGLAGMPALLEQPRLRLLRPLLGIDPARLRATLRKAGITWVEDPSNTNPAALRPRLRLNAPNDHHPALARAAQAAAIARAIEETRRAEELASIASLHAEGYAIIRASRLSAAALVSLIRAVTGTGIRRRPSLSRTLPRCFARPPSPGRASCPPAASAPAFSWSASREPWSRPSPPRKAQSGTTASASPRGSSRLHDRASCRSHRPPPPPESPPGCDPPYPSGHPRR